jgi:hypothetical protein
MRIPSRALKGALVTALVVAFVFSIALTHTPSAHSYGSLAQWQIGLSFNCDNPTFCSDLGGFWGWAEFDSDNSGDAEVAGCDHLQGGPAGGAQHISIEITGWTIGGNGDFFVTGEEDTITGHTGGPPITVIINSENFDTGVPAAAGHYSVQALFGMQAPPGTNFEIQVAQLNH